jgi:hypothetical protein
LKEVAAMFGRAALRSGLIRADSASASSEGQQN